MESHQPGHKDFKLDKDLYSFSDSLPQSEGLYDTTVDVRDGALHDRPREEEHRRIVRLLVVSIEGPEPSLNCRILEQQHRQPKGGVLKAHARGISAANAR